MDGNFLMKKLALLTLGLGLCHGALAQLDQDSMVRILRNTQRVALQPATFETRIADCPKLVKLGQKFIVQVEVTFPDGWHGYAPAAVEEGILTSVALAKNPNILSARAKMPDATTAEPNKHIYEGTIKIPVEIILKPSFSGKSVDAKVQVTAQMCNDSSCLPPETKELPVKFTINNLKGDRSPEDQKAFDKAKKARKAANKAKNAKKAKQDAKSKQDQGAGK